MNKNIEALNVYDTLKLALEALDHNSLFTSLMPGYDGRIIEKAYKAINKSLAEQPTPVEDPHKQQEPVAWMWKDGTVTTDPDRADGTWTPLYTSPPASKPWVGLTQQDIDIAFDDTQEGGGFDDFARAIEAKLKEKNNGTR